MRDESRHQQMARRGVSKAGQFSLVSLREAQRMLVRACGRLVLGHGAQEAVWAPYLDQVRPTDVALDLSCVHDVDARGLGVLADLARRARQRGTTVSVIAASSVVQRLVKMTRLDRALPGAWNERGAALSCGVARPGLTPFSAPRDANCGDERSAA